jgi:hypothetical protein
LGLQVSRLDAWKDWGCSGELSRPKDWPLLACSAIAEVFNAMLGQPLVAARKMWWRFGFDVLFVALLVGFAWVLVPKRGALGLASAFGFAYACTL